jgi:hypothetical protein
VAALPAEEHIVTMSPRRRASSHAFDFDRDVCERCGITRPHFDDNGRPPCVGRVSVPLPQPRIPVPD